MKKIIVLIIFACGSLISTLGQEHLSFKGVLLNGDLSDFITQMKSKELNLKEKNAKTAILEGSFINKNCTIYVYCSETESIVWKVEVLLPKKIQWDDLTSEYFSTKELYQHKYGKGKSQEFFSAPHKEGGIDELEALKNKKCMYITNFKTEAGNISVEITTCGCVKIIYKDRINADINKREILSIFNNEI